MTETGPVSMHFHSRDFLRFQFLTPCSIKNSPTTIKFGPVIFRDDLQLVFDCSKGASKSCKRV